jgi:hypothetical protein
MFFYWKTLDFYFFLHGKKFIKITTCVRRLFKMSMRYSGIRSISMPRTARAAWGPPGPHCVPKRAS